ncbi:MAG: DinB family protein [Gemmatimonadota bacterium]|nr:DinB family protein [Gemmatimonadota bacterium]MDH3423863.1 DinB family protein [Gemmatimonadota bacterium]
MKHYGPEDLARSFRTVRMNTLAAARDIPADKYDFSAADGFMTVEKLLTHIAISYRWQHEMHAVLKLSSMDGWDYMPLMTQLQEEEAMSRTKDEVVALLEQTGEIWASFLEGVSDDFLAESVTFPPEFSQPPKSRLEMLLSVKEHEMHHRGQLMLIQRLLGIVPHLTKQRMERMQAREAEQTA